MGMSNAATTIIVQCVAPEGHVSWSKTVEHAHGPTAWRKAWAIVDDIDGTSHRHAARKVRVTPSTWQLQVQA
jgi:hypothetical protein